MVFDHLPVQDYRLLESEFLELEGDGRPFVVEEDVLVEETDLLESIEAIEAEGLPHEAAGEIALVIFSRADPAGEVPVPFHRGGKGRDVIIVPRPLSLLGHQGRAGCDFRMVGKELIAVKTGLFRGHDVGIDGQDDKGTFLFLEITQADVVSGSEAAVHFGIEDDDLVLFLFLHLRSFLFPGIVVHDHDRAEELKGREHPRQGQRALGIVVIDKNSSHVHKSHLSRNGI